MQICKLVDHQKLFCQQHMQKTQYFHQVNVSAWQPMLKESFDDSGHRDFEEWIDKDRKKTSHLVFW